jgi:hypothetical protein
MRQGFGNNRFVDAWLVSRRSDGRAPTRSAATSPSQRGQDCARRNAGPWMGFTVAITADGYSLRTDQEPLPLPAITAWRRRGWDSSLLERPQRSAPR